MEDDKITSSGIPNPREVLDFQLNRLIKQLFKTFLILMEDLSNEHDESFRKLKQNLPQSKILIDQADYLSISKQEYIRKKILSAGNDCIREIHSNLDLFDLEFSKEQISKQNEQKNK